jgi:4-hydroxyproline epimerase
MKRIQILDSHTGGEPTRLVLDGFPDLGNGSMAERRQLLADEFDDWRAATVLEPRGSDVLVGALLCKPVDPEACAGVIFFNNAGYLGMCGHGTIGLVVSLAPTTSLPIAIARTSSSMSRGSVTSPATSPGAATGSS